MKRIALVPGMILVAVITLYSVCTARGEDAAAYAHLQRVSQQLAASAKHDCPCQCDCSLGGWCDCAVCACNGCPGKPSTYNEAVSVALEMRKSLYVWIGVKPDPSVAPNAIHFQVASPWQGVTGPARVESQIHPGDGKPFSKPWLEWRRTISLVVAAPMSYRLPPARRSC